MLWRWETFKNEKNIAIAKMKKQVPSSVLFKTGQLSNAYGTWKDIRFFKIEMG